jgi:uroporphyrinogen-III decarboxylase
MHEAICTHTADASTLCCVLCLTGATATNLAAAANAATAATTAAATVNNSAVLLDLLTDVVVDYLEAQAHAGADILQVRNILLECSFQ